MNKLEPGLIRPVNIRRYVALMRQRGFSPADTLAGTGVTEDRLRAADCLFDLEQCETVIRNMLRLTANPALGFEFGRALHLHQLGIVGHAMMSSSSLGQSIQRWLQYSPALLGILTRMELDELPDGHWTYSLSSQTASDSVYRFSVEESLTFGIELSRAWAGAPLDVVQARFAYPAPTEAVQEIYRGVFRAPLQFGSAVTMLEVRSPGLTQRLQNDDIDFADICSHQCTRAMARLSTSGSIKSRLRSLFLLSVRRVPDVDAAAQELGMSVRTLRRRLQVEGTSYREVLKDFQRDRAIEYLRSEHMAPKEVGYVLGFRHANDFTRAFKSWTGQTVSSFLRKEAA